MGLDIALGLIVLLGAIRGYLRGFVLQAIQLCGLVGALYAAVPIRDYARPHIQPMLPTLRPELLDRLLWWGAVVVGYFLMTGLAGWIYRSSRRHPLGDRDSNATDQGAGFVVGAAKGFVFASALAWAFDTYGIGHLKNIPWVDEQSRTSRSLEWSRARQPALQIWQSGPVQVLVAHVRRNGLATGEWSTTPELPADEAGSVGAVVDPPPGDRQAAVPPDGPSLKLPSLRIFPWASKPKPATPDSVAIPGRPSLDPRSPDFVAELDRALESEGLRPATAAGSR